MNITNGSVSRTYRPADFEGRTVTLSFTIDPGEDAEACVSKVSAMAERQARSLVEVPNVGEKTPAGNNKRGLQRPPEMPTEDKTATDPDDPGLKTASPGTEPEAKVVTDDELMKACQRTTTRLHDPAPTKATVRGFVEKAGMSVITIPQKDRAAFIAALDALKAEG